MLPDLRLRLPAPRIDFTGEVGASDQPHASFPGPGQVARYDWLRLYLLSLLSNQASFDTPVEYEVGSLWYNLNLDTLQVQQSDNQWHQLSDSLLIDSTNNLTLTQWYKAVKLNLTGNPNSPEPFSNAVFQSGSYNDPSWLTGLSTSKLVGFIPASTISGVLSPDRFPPVQIGSNIVNAGSSSILFTNVSGNLTQDSGIFTYNSTLKALQFNTNSNNPAIQINQTVSGNDGMLTLANLATTATIGVAGRTGAGTAGSVAGDLYLVNQHNILFSTDSGASNCAKFDSTGVLNFTNSSNNQLLLTQPSSVLGAQILFSTGAGNSLRLGIVGSNNLFVAGAAVGDAIISSGAPIRFSASGGGGNQLTLTNTGLSVAVPISCGDISCGTITSNDDLDCLGVVCSTVVAAGDIFGASFTGSGSGLTSIPQGAVTGLTAALAGKASGGSVWNLSGTNSGSSSNTVTAATSGATPLSLVGAASQTAPLLRFVNSSAAVVASVSAAGVFTGDGSGLININASLSNISGTIPVANGGTDAADAGTARTNLGLAIGTNVQAWNTKLDSIAGVTPTKGLLLTGTGSSWSTITPGPNASILVADSTQSVGLRWSTSLASPGSGTNSEQYGTGATATGTYGTALGDGAAATSQSTALGGLAAAGANATAVGASTAAPANAVAVGFNAVSTGQFGVILGSGAAGSNDYDIAIGYQAALASGAAPGILIGRSGSGAQGSLALGHQTTAVSDSIAIGHGATTTAAGQLVIGSSAFHITDVYFGAGLKSTSSTPVILHGTGGSGANNAGSNLVLAGGSGTGTGTAGAVIFQIAPPGSSGSSSNTLVECGRFTAAGVLSIQTELITAPTAGIVPLAVAGAVSQTGDLTQWYDSSSDLLARVSSTGFLGIGSSSNYPLSISNSSALARLVDLNFTTSATASYSIYSILSSSGTDAYGAYYNVSGSTNSYGVKGDVAATSGQAIGVFGKSSGSNSSESYGLYGECDNSGTGNAYGVRGVGNGTSLAAYGGHFAAINSNTANNYGVYATASSGNNNYAGFFGGKVTVQGPSGDNILELENSSGTLTGWVGPLGQPAGSLALAQVAGGRLTLSSTDPCPSGSQSSSTIYYLPQSSNQISLYNPTTSDLETITFSGLSLSISALTASTLYDVFVVNGGGGSLSLATQAWSSSTAGSSTRNVAVSKTTDGVLVLAGSITNRYVGTIYISGTIGVCLDNPNQRYVWNYNNRVDRNLLNVVVPSSSWSYNVNCWRPFDQTSVTNIKHVEVVVGWQDGALASISASLVATVVNNGAAYCAVALDAPTGTASCGWNSTLASPLIGQIGLAGGAPAQTSTSSISSQLIHHPTVGYHYYTGMENTIGNTTFSSTTGLMGTLSC